MAAVTICSDFGAPKNKVWHCFHCFPIYFPWSDGTGCHDLHFLNVQLSLLSNSHLHTWLLEKPWWTFVGKVISLLLNMLSSLVITFLPSSKCLLISWLQSPSAVILEAPKVSHCFHCFPIYLPWSDGTRCHILVFWMLSFKPTFSFSFFTFIKRLIYCYVILKINEHLLVFSAFFRSAWFSFRTFLKITNQKTREEDENCQYKKLKI